MKLSKQTLVDWRLTHQLVITSATNATVNVSCNCRIERGEPLVDDPIAVNHPIGQSHNTDETKALYNDPENHWKPFTEEDELRW